MSNTDYYQDDIHYQSDMDDFKDSTTSIKRMTRATYQKLCSSKSDQQPKTANKRKKPPVSHKERPQEPRTQQQKKTPHAVTAASKSTTQKKSTKRRRVDVYSTEEEDEDNDDEESDNSKNISDNEYSRGFARKTTRPDTTKRYTRPKKPKNYIESSISDIEEIQQPKKKKSHRQQQQQQQTTLASRKKETKMNKTAKTLSPPAYDETHTIFKFPLKILPNQLVFQDDTLLGEGRTARVVTAKYGQVLVACKARRTNQPRTQFEQRLARELEFAAILSACRSMNRYVGVLTCKRSELIYKTKKRFMHAKDETEHFAVQRYFKHGDLLEYVEKRQGGRLHPIEVLQIAIHLFSALTDAHNLDVGLVDVKRENVLIDNAGSAVLTDFGSCVKMDEEKIDLDTTEDGVHWTAEVAAPEMIGQHEFYLASDVFMATVIVGELTVSPMTSQTFQQEVLQRQRRSGLVNFQSSMIPPAYRTFCPLLKRGFHNDPTERLTAAKGLEFLEEMYQASFDMKLKEIEPLSSISAIAEDSYVYTETEEDAETPTTLMAMYDSTPMTPIMADEPVTAPCNNVNDIQKEIVQEKEDDFFGIFEGGKSISSLSSSKLTEELASSNDDDTDWNCNELTIPNPLISEKDTLTTVTSAHNDGCQSPKESTNDNVHNNSNSESDRSDRSAYNDDDDDDNWDSKTENYVTPTSSSYGEDPGDDEVQFVNASRHTSYRANSPFESRFIANRPSFTKRYSSSNNLRKMHSVFSKKLLSGNRGNG
ncbi:kinase-like domain-containing protein [Phascolomyces articulosus]|uniref:Kinase-like domain-containing protein n=1 Tax=Phascolomyces articulosus TaxID=60185 RepID=A0AAD5KKR7_9FUNG|nr:kinase-like domain-containing protein [Phascolomyces articulosus]